MGKINILPKEVAELIAAGEVVERPASIAKELLENAMDAGASTITIELRQGGIGYLRVTDNGSGIAAEEIPTAFIRHATSKIERSDDLNSIATLGFRGEALASIAAVSRMELTSKTREASLGACIRLEGGEQTDFAEAGCPDGTTVIVRDLFYNVPARLKFLRKDTSEANAVASIVEKLAISHPEISIKLIVDRKIRLHTPGDGDLPAAIHAVFGSEVSSGLLPVDYGMNGVSVRGYTSQPEQSRSTRSMQHFFVNARYIRSKVCYAALEDAYKNSVMSGKYPYCFLYVSLPYEAVDVNVHPAKTEVRFQDERRIYDVVYFAVKSALSREDILKKAAQVSAPTRVPNLLSGFHSDSESTQTVLRQAIPPAVPTGGPAEPPAADRPPVPAPAQATSIPPSSGLHVKSPQTSYHAGRPDPVPAADDTEGYRYITPEMLQRQAPSVRFVPEPEEDVSDPAASPDLASPKPGEDTLPFSARVIGELFHTYVLFEAGDMFYLLDKHAAHERILFEQLKRSVELGERQVLLSPIPVTVSAEECETAREQTALLQKMGFAFEDFGEHTLLLREVPLLLTAEGDIRDMFLDTLRRLQDNRREITSEGYENLLHSIACRAAVKANDPNGIPELTELLRQVYENDEIRHCPHGRPVAIGFTRADIEKRFGRI